MLSSEFFEKLRAGQKEFENIELSYINFDGKNLKNFKIKNSKLVFSSMRHCSIENVIFENCEFFFFGFGHSTLKNTKFIGCQMDYGGFIEAIFNNTLMSNTKLSWSTFINAKLGGLEMKNCSEFKVFNNTSEITPSDMQQAMTDLKPLITKLDFDMQHHINQQIESVANRMKVEMPQSTGLHSYGIKGTSQSYAKFFDATINSAIEAYGEKQSYKKTKGPYESKSKYGK